MNILLSFAQFERELAGERIRDKFAASRRKGIFMGGHPPLGYDVRDRKLVVNPAEAELVRLIFRRFLDLGSALLLIRELTSCPRSSSGSTAKLQASHAAMSLVSHQQARQFLGSREVKLPPLPPWPRARCPTKATLPTPSPPTDRSAQ